MIINRKQVLETNLALLVVCIIFYFITGSMVFIYIAFGLGLVTLFINPLAKLITQFWMLFGKFMGGILSCVVLTLLFIIILVPVAFLYRLTGKSKKSTPAETYFTIREEKVQPGHFENPW